MSLLSLPTIQPQPGTIYQWGRLYGDSYALLLCETAQHLINTPLLVTVPSNQAAHELIEQVNFFADGKLPVMYFPDWETLPYDHCSPHPNIVSARLAVLHQLIHCKHGLLVTTINALMQRLAPVDYIHKHTGQFKVGEHLDIEVCRQQLVQAGYYHTSQVTEHGQFAVRGALIDLFPSGGHDPIRIDLFDCKIESIRLFDPQTQRSTKTVNAVCLLPAREFPLDQQGIDRFCQQFRHEFNNNPSHCPIYNDISQGIASAGSEHYLPLFFERTALLFDYLPEKTTLVAIDAVFEQASDCYAQVERHYEAHRDDTIHPILKPHQLYLNTELLSQQLIRYPQIHLQPFAYEQKNQYIHNFSTAAIPDLRIQPRTQDPALLLRSYIQDFPGRILITSDTPGQREQLLDILIGLTIRPTITKDWDDFLNHRDRLCLSVAPIYTGVCLPDADIAIITAQQILRRYVRRSTHLNRPDPQHVFNDLAEIHIGTPVVHEEHGIGRYAGLQTLQINGYDEEFLTLAYADDDKLYVPVAYLHLISRYTGGSNDQAPLHRLGSGHWLKIKRRAAQKARDVAAELLEIHAHRKLQTGHAHLIDEIAYQAFIEHFPFEETDDQLNAIASVMTDMQSTLPMDRVVCGDVGFGKTEVAMRAAFIAIHAHKQVAILAPTTLLVQQHYQSFCDRFANWPVHIATLSRFNSKKQTQQTCQQLAQGKIDIVIGTHKLLNQANQFKALGLVVIDEEHRFGVRHKEQIKKWRGQVDMLTLTATPIPRTLNMLLSGLRELSIIATAPMQRLSIKTFINEWRDLLIQEACLREIKRGGQIYFLHNNVHTIEKTAQHIQQLLPQARIGIAHGQMPERDLEQVMLAFYHRQYNILVCTTIIESGIDIPTANTILINRADKLGLAQLHQLRGRVGRSYHQAYAYLITPPRKLMTADALKRIEAIESMEDLGAGFSLASHDLEIRGSGELLGEEQSGQIAEIGYTLYTDLLKRAVTTLQADGQALIDTKDQAKTPDIQLHLPALLPEDYLPDVHTRLVQYKRVASAIDETTLQNLQVEMIDRFGLLPTAAKNLFASAVLKIRAKQIGIKKINVTDSEGYIVFNNNPNIDPGCLVRLVQASPNHYSFAKQNTFKFHIDKPDDHYRLQTLFDLLTQLETYQAA